jgi:hypothetical protein
MLHGTVALMERCFAEATKERIRMRRDNDHIPAVSELQHIKAQAKCVLT